MIKFTNVSKAFGGRTVLDRIQFGLAGGQTHVLLGLSGSGKSTVLRLMLGLTECDTGEVEMNGIRVSPETQRMVAEKVGYVPQEGGLFPHLTAYENVTITTRTWRWPKAKYEARVRELSELLEIDPTLLKRYPRQLSGGQRQRIGLMRATLLDPSIYLLDEPLGALDPITRFELQTELKRIFNRLKKTVVVVTHDVGEAAYFGHTISLLHQGKIEQHGPFADFVRHPASPFVTQFIRAQRPPPELEEYL